MLPDKAIDLIDQAGARLRLRLGVKVDTGALMARLGELEAEKNAAVGAERYEEASRIRDQIAEVQGRLDDASTRSARSTTEGESVVDEAEIAAVISRATGIPVNRLTETERERLATLEDELHDRVIGQDDAVAAVAKAVRRNRTGMGDARRPVGSFLFLGPTGVGKTELAKALAESLFDDEGAVIRFDMSEFGERHTVSRLVGAPPGYVGYDEAGQLTERVRRSPYSIVLFDEIEKAHPDVFNLLLQVLDDGRLTDGQGRTVDFRNTVVVMTSNIGSEFLASRSGAIGFIADGGGATGFGSEKDLRDRVMGKLREAMRPEFLNRIDEIVLFRKLEKPQLREIVSLLLGATEKRLAKREVTLQVTDAAIDWLAENGYEPEYGARPLRRLIQREVDDRIAELFVSGALVDGGSVTVDAASGDITVRVRAARRRRLTALTSRGFARPRQCPLGSAADTLARHGGLWDVGPGWQADAMTLPSRRVGAIFLPDLPPEQLRDYAQAAEAAGIEELWLWEDCFREGGVLERGGRPRLDRAPADRDRDLSDAAAQRRDRGDGDRDGRAHVPRPPDPGRRARRAVVDGSGRRARRLAADADARVRARRCALCSPARA